MESTSNKADRSILPPCHLFTLTHPLLPRMRQQGVRYSALLAEPESCGSVNSAVELEAQYLAQGVFGEFGLADTDKVYLLIRYSRAVVVFGI